MRHTTPTRILIFTLVAGVAAVIILLALQRRDDPSPHANAPAAAAAEPCDPSLWNHVYHPSRLAVFSPCITVTGVIVDATHGKRRDGARKESDGDVHGWLRLDPEFSHLLDQGNLTEEDGNLVFEIVCYSKPRQTDAVDACPADFRNPIELPPVGSHVAVTGAYVQDDNHAHWMEIHPVSSIKLAD